MRLWNPWTGKELLRTLAPWQWVQFSRDDRFLLVDRHLWEVKTGRACREFHYPTHDPARQAPGGGFGSAVAFTPDGRLLVSMGNDGLGVWDVATGEHVVRLAPPLDVLFENGFLVAPDGRSVLVRQPQGLYRWPLALEHADAGRRLHIGPPDRLAPPKVGPVALRPDSRGVLVQQLHRGVVDFDPTEPAEQRLMIADDSGWRNFRPSSDGKWIASGSWHSTGARVWNLETGQLVRELTNGETLVAFSPDSRWLVTASEREHIVWEVGSWEPPAPTRPAPRRRTSRSPGFFSGQQGDGRLLFPSGGDTACGGGQWKAPGHLARVDRNRGVQSRWESAGGGPEQHAALGPPNDPPALAEMGLDWDQPPCPPAPAWQTECPPHPCR